VLTCVTMALAGAMVNADSAEGRAFAVRVVPGLNRANAVVAALLLATGMVNLFAAGARRHFNFPPAFSRVLAVKLGLYSLMTAALMASLRTERGLRQANPGESLRAGAARVIMLCAITAFAGAAAMLLGVWLAGE
jgi:hypothetical protein